MIEIQKCLDREEWDEYVLENNGHPLQLWGWGQVKAGHGWKADRLFAYDSSDPDRIVAAAQVLTRRLPYPLKAFSYVPRGPVGIDESNQESKEEFLDLIAEFSKREHSSVAISIEPASKEFTVPLGWNRAQNSILPSETVALDLTLPESQLLADMAKKTRQYIRKSAAEAVTIKRVQKPDEIKKILAIYHDTSKRAGFNLHSDQYYYDVARSLEDNSLIYATYEGDEPIAFLWLAISAHTAFELYGGVNERGQELRVNYALKWHAIRKLKEWGLENYDFGGLISGGVSVFKQGWSETPTHLAGTFDKPLSPFYMMWTKWLPTAKKLVRAVKPKR